MGNRLIAEWSVQVGTLRSSRSQEGPHYSIWRRLLDLEEGREREAGEYVTIGGFGTCVPYKYRYYTQGVDFGSEGTRTLRRRCDGPQSFRLGRLRYTGSLDYAMIW